MLLHKIYSLFLWFFPYYIYLMIYCRAFSMLLTALPYIHCFRASRATAICTSPIPEKNTACVTNLIKFPNFQNGGKQTNTCWNNSTKIWSFLGVQNLFSDIHLNIFNVDLIRCIFLQIVFEIQLPKVKSVWYKPFNAGV